MKRRLGLHIKMRVFIVSFIILISVIPAYASEKAIEIEATGEAYMGEIETQKEVKDRAKRDAESRAIDLAVGTFVRSHTVVSNSQLADDLIYAAVRGKIDKVEVIKEWWDEKERNLYKVKLKALIEPVYPEAGEGLSIKLSLSKTNLKEGEEVKIFYQVNSDCYIYIFSIAADGSVTLLLPNSIVLDNSVKGGKAYSFPPDGSEIQLTAQFLPGYEKAAAEERIKIIATRQKEEIISLGFKEGLFKVYDAKSTGMISDLVKRLNQISPSDWTEASAVYVLKR